MHPNFKPIFVGTFVELMQQEHMKILPVVKTIPAKETWHPCFDETVNDIGEFVSGNVKIFLRPSYNGVIYQNKFHVENWNWRIAIWGADDLGLEFYLNSKNDAWNLWHNFDQCPTRDTLIDLYGFQYA
jgi:hypothetical protein